MPNNIKNRIQFIGDPELVKEAIEAFTTHHPETPHYSWKGERTYEKEGCDHEYGWLNEETNMFTVRDKEPVEGVPEGYVPHFNKSWDQFPDFEKIIAPPKDDPAYNDKPSQREAESSPNWWNTWNRKNWGTKWNCYCCEKESEDTFTFETAWQDVSELMEKIGEKFPDLEIKYEYSDEDFGYRCGFMHMKDGLSETNILKGGSKEACELAFKLRPDLKKYYKLEYGEYVHKSEEEMKEEGIEY